MVLRNLLYFISILLVIGWVLGYFVWPHEGHTIHSLLALAVISLVAGLVLSRKKNND
jgi:membrane protein DedA with SNARE-associated domain